MSRIIYITLITVPLLLSCGDNGYREFRVYPVKKELRSAPGGSSFIPFKIEMPDGFHVYSNPKGPGTGRATRIHPAKNKNFSFEPARFLPAEKYYYPGDSKHVWIYHDETFIFLPFKTREKSRPARETVKIKFTSLICNDSECIPQNHAFNYPIVIVNDKTLITRHNPDITRLFKQAKSPDTLKKTTRFITTGNTGQQKKLALLKDLSFSPRTIEGSKISGLLQAIIFGLIAGLILNIMPCVLPVVSLKIMSFVKHAGKNRKELSLLGLLFSLGILVSFAALASLAAFFGYNWGGLFQHSLFIIIMAAIVLALALSMFGLFTLNMPSFVGGAAKTKDNPYGDAFMKGLLATLLATPCSGPFLGGTLAWALSQPPLTIFIIFMSVGVGMALPYIILTINPAFTKFIPKPGPWMETFEKIMAFLLVFTVVYLISILDSSSTMPAVTFLVFLAMGLWQYGKYGSIIETKLKRAVSFLVLIIIILSGYFISFEYLYSPAKSVKIKSTPFSLDRLYKNRDAGKISLIKFTADWCPNCRFVEKISLYTENVHKAVISNNIDLFIADITRPSPVEEALLGKFDSRSIPVLAVMPAGPSFRRPIILRDIYSEDEVLKAIDMAKGGTRKKPKIKFNIK